MSSSVRSFGRAELVPDLGVTCLTQGVRRGSRTARHPWRRSAHQPAERGDSMRAVTLAVATFGAAAALAAPSTGGDLCVCPTMAGLPVTSGAPTGTCPSGSTTVQMPSSAADQQTLIDILPYLRFQAAGIGGKPTIVVKGANVQVRRGDGGVDGSGKPARRLNLRQLHTPPAIPAPRTSSSVTTTTGPAAPTPSSVKPRKWPAVTTSSRGAAITRRAAPPSSQAAVT